MYVKAGSCCVAACWYKSINEVVYCQELLIHTQFCETLSGKFWNVVNQQPPLIEVAILADS